MGPIRFASRGFLNAASEFAGIDSEFRHGQAPFAAAAIL